MNRWTRMVRRWRRRRPPVGPLSERAAADRLHPRTGNVLPYPLHPPIDEVNDGLDSHRGGPDRPAA